jgi:hypothetical protein
MPSSLTSCQRSEALSILMKPPSGDRVRTSDKTLVTMDDFSSLEVASEYSSNLELMSSRNDSLPDISWLFSERDKENNQVRTSSLKLSAISYSVATTVALESQMIWPEDSRNSASTTHCTAPTFPIAASFPSSDQNVKVRRRVV